ncbi:MAG: hypothetical protein HOI43_17165 [Gammaproteobacteria bacterium]|nr:hypothetical protein [Gammaproteobacteria bacterium]
MISSLRIGIINWAFNLVCDIDRKVIWEMLEIYERSSSATQGNAIRISRVIGVCRCPG